MNQLITQSSTLVNRTDTRFIRYLYGQINWNNRLTGIKGSRGTGKTTLLLQRLKLLDKPDYEASWWSMDDFYFTANALIATVETFVTNGGKYLFLDEVHKYPNWSREIKNIYDFYPDLRVVFTGSSIIDISREEADLSRRARMYELRGLSFREYLSFSGVLHAERLTLESILAKERHWRTSFPPDFKPIIHFNAYLKTGYYPFFAEDPEGYSSRLNQLARLIVESDMAELHDFDIRNARKMLQLLYVISSNVPFKPNLTSLAEKSGIHRNSVSNYLHYLEQAQLLSLLYPAGISVAILQKPEKIYLENTNLAVALASGTPDEGNIRETFFLNQLKALFKVNYPKHGDFLVENRWTFELGGKNKSGKQIEGIPESFVVQDDIEYPAAGPLPLWIFGFLY